MPIRDAQGHLRITWETIDELLEMVQTDGVLGNLVTELAPEPALWGVSTLHFSARHQPSDAPVLLKLNVAGDQVWWTRMLARAAPAFVPQVYAVGERLGDEPLGWVLWERVPGGLHPGWNGREFAVLLEAGVQFQRATRTLAAAAQAAGVLNELRVDELAARLEQGIQRGVPGPAARVLRRLDADWAWVTAVCETEVCHGDLHLANALSREGPPDGVALLIDYHPTRMPWAYDATKPEILNADPRRLGCRGLVVKQAAMRERYGLSVPAGAELRRLQAIVLGWRAMEVWGYVGSSPDPAWRERGIWHAENGAYIAAAAAA